MSKQRRDRLEAVAGIVLASLGVLLVAVLLWRYVAPSSSEEPSVGVIESEPGIGLWDAYERAAAAAEAVAEDAQLVSASAQWQGPDEERLLAGADIWSFVFYAATNSSIVDIVVGDEAATVVNQTQVLSTPAALPEDAVRAGPRDPLLIFLAYGGSTFLEEYPSAIVDLHLGAGGGAEAVWSSSAIDIEQRKSVSVVIDAETHDVVSAAP